MTLRCPLCDSSHILPLSHLAMGGVHYWHCLECDLISMDPDFFLSSVDEKARYENHQNIEGDADYEKFLGQLWAPLQKFLSQRKSQRQTGIDFGSGPGPALQKMIKRDGYACEVYDPYYAQDQSVLSRQYNFAVSTEVVEHFNFPQKAWAQLLNLVKPGGYLGVMTQLHPGGAEAASFFEKWWYARDPAHVCFYSEKTLRWILERAGFEILKMQNPILIARRQI